MTVDIKELGRERAEQTVEGGVMGADLVTGAAVTVAENVARVVTNPTREAHKLERRGAAANKTIAREVENVFEDTAEVVEAFMPERIALRGVQAIKARARRKDIFGDVAYRTLEVLNGGFEAAVRTLARFERATEPPARSGTRQVTPARPARKAATRTRRTVRRTAAATRSTARRGTAQARRTERKSA